MERPGFGRGNPRKGSSEGPPLWGGALRGLGRQGWVALSCFLSSSEEAGEELGESGARGLGEGQQEGLRQGWGRREESKQGCASVRK